MADPMRFDVLIRLGQLEMPSDFSIEEFPFQDGLISPGRIHHLNPHSDIRSCRPSGSLHIPADGTRDRQSGGKFLPLGCGECDDLETVTVAKDGRAIQGAHLTEESEFFACVEPGQERPVIGPEGSFQRITGERGRDASEEAAP